MCSALMTFEFATISHFIHQPFPANKTLDQSPDQTPDGKRSFAAGPEQPLEALPRSTASHTRWFRHIDPTSVPLQHPDPTPQPELTRRRGWVCRPVCWGCCYIHKSLFFLISFRRNRVLLLTPGSGEGERHHPRSIAAFGASSI